MTENVVIFTSYRLLDEEGPEERAAMEAVFGAENVVEELYRIPEGSLVVPRYRALPFGDLLEREIVHNGSTLINTYHQHRNIADSRNWAHLLKGLTPDQYTIHDLPYLPEGEYFAKGETNSRKHDWFGSAYAKDKAALIRLVGNLQADSMIGTQEIIIKPYQHYRQIATAVTGQPIFHERRVFVLDGQVLSDAPYWSNFPEAYENLDYDQEAYQGTLHEAITRVRDIARYIVIDMVEYPDGHWGVVELNDGSMSGLSANDPHVLWPQFAKAIQS
jgi:hypothetical protein